MSLILKLQEEIINNLSYAEVGTTLIARNAKDLQTE